MMQFKTVEEDAIVSMMHAEMLFIRGMCGPQTWKPSDTECRMEMGTCLVEAGKVLQKGASIALKPDEPRGGGGEELGVLDDERRRLCTNFLMTSGAIFNALRPGITPHG